MGSGHVFCQFIDFSFHSSSTFSLSLASVLAILACDQQVAVVNGSTALIWEFNGNIVAFPVGSAEKNPPQQKRIRMAVQEMGVRLGVLGWGFNPWVRKIPLEEEMATHSSILAWGIPWTEEPGGLRSMESWNQI